MKWMVLVLLFCLTGFSKTPSQKLELGLVYDIDSTLIETIAYKKINKYIYKKYIPKNKVTYNNIKDATFKYYDLSKTPETLKDPHFLDQIIELKNEYKGNYYITYYRLLDHAQEIIKRQLEQGFKIYFFSAGAFCTEVG